jgi:CheY-like chemotaxis protein
VIVDSAKGGVPQVVTTAMHVVLIVEDDSNARNELHSLFATNGFRVVVAETARRGLRAARAHRPDMIVVNLKLRDMDGTRFVRELRAWSMVPLIVMSPAAAESQRLEAFELGADECIARPISALEFVARVWAILRRCVRTQSAQPNLRIGSVRLYHSDKYPRTAAHWRKDSHVPPPPGSGRRQRCLESRATRSRSGMSAPNLAVNALRRLQRISTSRRFLSTSMLAVSDLLLRSCRSEDGMLTLFADHDATQAPDCSFVPGLATRAPGALVPSGRCERMGNSSLAGHTSISIKGKGR